MVIAEAQRHEDAKKNKKVNLFFFFAPLLLCVLAFFLVGCSAEITPHTPSQIKLTDVALEVGLDFQQSAFRWSVSGDPIAMMGGGLCWVDFDSDGWLDLYVVNSYAQEEAGRWQSDEGGLPTSRLYRNVEGRFEDVSEASGTGISMRGNGCISADFNNDSHPDIFITTSRDNLLLWNNGNGTFTEGGREAGVGTYGWQTAAAAGDLNGDGWLDLFVAGYVDINNRIEEASMGFPNTNYGLRDLLFLSNGMQDGQVTFSEVGEAIGLEAADFEYGLGAALNDFDGDGRLDLFVSNDTNPNRLYLNMALDDVEDAFGFRMVEVGAQAEINDRNSGMGVASADYDGDGASDLFITNMGEQLHSLYRSSAESSGSFINALDEIDLAELGAGQTGWGTSWVDIDLDSDMDLLVFNGAIPISNLETDGQLARLYLNQTAQGERGKFVYGSEGAGLIDIGPVIGRGSAVADFDNDGDPDVAVNTIGGQLRLLRNDGANGNWLMLEGLSAGTRVSAELADGTILVREMQSGSSYLASEDPRCLLGLGGFAEVKQLTIRFPDGTEKTLENVPSNQVLQGSELSSN